MLLHLPDEVLLPLYRQMGKCGSQQLFHPRKLTEYYISGFPSQHHPYLRLLLFHLFWHLLFLFLQYLWYKGQYYATKLTEVNSEGYYLTGWYDNFGCAAGKRVRVIVAVKKD